MAKKQGITLAPEVHRRFEAFHTSGLPRMVAEAHIDTTTDLAGEASEVSVELETTLRLGMPWSLSDKPTVEISIKAEGAPGRGDSYQDVAPSPVEVWPNDVPQVIACLVTAAYYGVEYGSLPKIDPEGEALIRALYAILPQSEFPAKKVEG